MDGINIKKKIYPKISPNNLIAGKNIDWSCMEEKEKNNEKEERKEKK